jgi:hypothetical protein
MRQFNAELAKKGNPVITNLHEEEVKDFTWFPSLNMFIGSVNGGIYSWDESGKCRPINGGNNTLIGFDLFMKPQKIEKFVVINISDAPDIRLRTPTMYNTEQEAFDSIESYFSTETFAIQKMEIQL